MAEIENKRKYQRVKAPKALVAWKTGTQKTVSQLENLGLGGLFVSTKTPPTVGTVLHMVFNTPQGEVRVRATVRLVKPAEGMGVSISSMDPEDRGRLDRWLKQLAHIEEPVGAQG
jgi:hypothetical protein